MRRLHHFALLTTLVALAVSVQAQPSPPAVANTAAQASAMDDALFYQLLLAEISHTQGDAAQAYALFFDAATKAHDARLYQRALDIAQQAREGAAMLQTARAWKAAFPDSQEANRQIFQTLLGLNRVAETLPPLREELSHHSGEARNVFISQLPRLYARASDKAGAAKVVEQALTKDLDTPQTAASAWATVGRLRLNASNPEGAQEAGRRVLAHASLPDSVALLALELMTQKLPPGEALLLKLLQTHRDPELRMAYVRTLLQLQRWADAKQQLQLLIQQAPDLPQAWMIQASLQMQDGDIAQAEQSLQRYLSLAPTQPTSTGEPGRGVPQAYLYLADIAVQRNDLAAALAWLDRIDPAAATRAVATRRANILAKQGHYEQARAAIRAMPDAAPGDADAKLLAEAQLLRDAKQYRQAYELLSGRTPPDADLLYEQAMLAEKLGDLVDMERLLRAVIQIKPTSAAAYNALGYSLAERRLRLPEAKALIQKALVYAPADPFITDSLGWVEFRLGNAAEAARLLEAAYQARADAEIAAHLGEVLWSLGQRERALDFWKQAQRLNPHSETLLETLKRLQVTW